MPGRLLAAAALLACACAPGWGLPHERPLRLYVFDCGRVRVGDASRLSLAPEDLPDRDLFVPCYLVEHPKGRLLWETGLAPSVAESFDGVPTPDGGRMWLDATLPAQLSLLALGPHDVDFVAFADTRPDRVGDAADFSRSTLLIQRAELASASAAAFAAGPHLALDGDDDVFGDGEVRILSAPGPTPGHQVLFVKLRETGPVLLAGDLYATAASRRLGRASGLDADPARTLASRQRIEAFAAREGAALWIEHDPQQAKSLRLAPEFYE